MAPNDSTLHDPNEAVKCRGDHNAPKNITYHFLWWLLYVLQRGRYDQNSFSIGRIRGKRIKQFCIAHILHIHPSVYETDSTMISTITSFSTQRLEQYDQHSQTTFPKSEFGIFLFKYHWNVSIKWSSWHGVIIDPGSLASKRRQVIIRTNIYLSLIGLSGTNVRNCNQSESIFLGNALEMSSAKCRPFYLGFIVITLIWETLNGIDLVIKLSELRNLIT